MNIHRLSRWVLMGGFLWVMLAATTRPAAARTIDDLGAGNALPGMAANLPSDAPQAAPVAVDDSFTTKEDIPLNQPAIQHRALQTMLATSRMTAGNMFLVSAYRKNLLIAGFDVNLGESGPQVVEVWYKSGTYAGFEQTPAAWTLLISTTVESQGYGHPTYVPVDNFRVSALTTYSFYIQTTTTYLICTNNISSYSGGYIDFWGGTANNLNWGAFLTGKAWYGRIYYDVLDGVLGNDSDADEDVLTAILDSGPANGEVNLFPDGGFVYTPTLNFYGLDTFTYIASDGVLTDTALVTIDVKQVDFSPVAKDDTYITDEDAPLSKMEIYHRSLETYFDDDWLIAGNMFEVSAQHPLTITGFDVHIALTGTQTVEVWYKSGTYHGFEQDPTAWTLLGSAEVDSQGAGYLTYVPIGGLSISPGGTFGLYIQSTTSSFLSDYCGGAHPDIFSNQDIFLEMGAASEAPWGYSCFWVTWSGVIYYDTVDGVMVNDTDRNGDMLTVTLTSGPANGALSLYPDGRFVYTPTLNFYGADSFSYMVTDGRLTDTAAVSITVLPFEDDPYVDAGVDFATPEGLPAAFLGIFTDPDWRLAEESIHWDFGDGETITGTYTPTHRYQDNGVFTVTLTVTDALNFARSDWLIVTVDNVAPLLTPISDTETTLGAPITITAAFTDPGLLDTHILTIAWGDGLTETFDLSPGVLSLDLSHTYTAPGHFTVAISVRDKDGGLDDLVFDVNVPPMNYVISIPMLLRK